jgi:hypothetical protein
MHCIAHQRGDLHCKHPILPSSNCQRPFSTASEPTLHPVPAGRWSSTRPATTFLPATATATMARLGWRSRSPSRSSAPPARSTDRCVHQGPRPPCCWWPSLAQGPCFRAWPPRRIASQRAHASSHPDAVQVNSLEDMRRFVMEHSDFSRAQGVVSKHVNVMTALSEQVGSRHLMDVSSVSIGPPGVGAASLLVPPPGMVVFLAVCRCSCSRDCSLSLLLAPPHLHSSSRSLQTQLRL